MTPRKKTTPRKTPTQERSRDMVVTILQATARVLRRRGFAAASTNLIAQEAGVSIGSLYQYFPNRESLISLVFRQMVEDDLDFLSKTFTSCDSLPLRAAWKTIVTALFDRYRTDVTLRRVMVEQCPRLGSADPFSQFKERLTALFLTEFSRRELPLAPAKAGSTAFVITHALEGVLRGAVIEGSRWDLDEIQNQAETLVLAFINAHCSTQGRAPQH